MINLFYTLALAALLLFSPGCNKDKKQGLRVAASPVPHAEMLEYIKPALKEKGIDLIIIVTDDYNIPNRALANQEIEANFFQHQPFLDAQVNAFHYPILSIANIMVEPIAIYSKKVKSLGELKDNSVIAVPNDPTNEARALLLLQREGLIKLKDPANRQATVLDISENPKKIKFIEVDAATLPRTLDDVDAAAINTNYALQANLHPEKDGIAIENKDSPYMNVLVIHADSKDDPEIKALKEELTSDKMRSFLLEKYKGAVIPSF